MDAVKKNDGAYKCLIHEQVSALYSNPLMLYTTDGEPDARNEPKNHSVKLDNASDNFSH